MKNLISQLMVQTESLKNDYVAAVELAAVEYVNRLISTPYTNRTGKETAAEYHRSVKENLNRGYFTHPETKVAATAKYINDAKKAAVVHYENSIIKLAERILKKGLNDASVTVNSARVDVNIECTITDGFKTVKAWTIVAWGEIQRPHYRFLVK